MFEPQTAPAIQSIDAALAALDPSIRLVPARRFDRVARALHPGSRVPRTRGYLMLDRKSGPARAASLDTASGAGAVSDTPAPQLWIRHDPRIDRLPCQQRLRCFWSNLLGAKVRESLSAQAACGRLNVDAVEERLRELGSLATGEFEEIARWEGWIAPSASDLELYAEFAARFLTLRHFTPRALHDVFPHVDTAHVETILARDLDVNALLESTRPEGAADAELPAPSEPVGHDLEAPEPVLVEPSPRRDRLSIERVRRLVRAAERATARANRCRAVLCYTRAATLESSARAGQLRSRARRSLAQLAASIERALDPETSRAADWSGALEPLLEHCTGGFRRPAARLLYNLQLVARVQERPPFRLDFARWLGARGRAPLRRPLELLPNVLALRSLRRALGRLGRVRLSLTDRERLVGCLHEAIAKLESRLRTQVRPRVQAALAQAGLAPGNVPESVGHARMIEELLDMLTSRGYLRASDLRDAIARSPVKLADLTPQALVGRDTYLKADHHLASALTGLYHRAEIYLRAIQKASSLAFGTRPGRWLVLWLVIPFGGVFVALEGLQHMLDPIAHVLAPPHAHTRANVFEPALRASSLGLANPALPPTAAKEIEHHLNPHHVHLISPASLLVLGTLVLILMHSAAARALAARVGWATWQGMETVARSLPKWVLSVPWIATLLSLPWLRTAWRTLIRPSLLGALMGWFAQAVTGRSEIGWIVGAACWLTAWFLSCTVLGRAWVTEFHEHVARLGEWIGTDVIPGLYRTIMDAFRHSLDLLDRVLHAVDESLRYRAGDSRLGLGFKAIGQAIWSVLSYLVRLVMNLLVEPQVNPIKHFPVVTVAHKVMLPFVLALAPVFMAPPFALAADMAYGLVAAIQLLLPGVFGFLIWELKENWKLYEANRPKFLKPLPVGSHGETVVRLLRRGLHSGTIPNAYHQLRRASEKLDPLEQARARHKPRETLEHVEHAIRHFLERDLIALLNATRALGSPVLSVGSIALSPTSIQAELCSPAHPQEPARLSLRETKGWLVAEMDEPAPRWLAGLSRAERTTFSNALLGLFQYGGSDLSLQQASHLIGVPSSSIAVERDGLEVALPDHPTSWYTLRIARGLRRGCDNLALADRLLLARNRIAWPNWVDTWKARDAFPQRLADADVLPLEHATPETSLARSEP